jgi:hypothetical protein
MNKNLTVIIPIHYITEKEYELYLEPALNSVVAQENSNSNVLFVLSSEVYNSGLIDNIKTNFEETFKGFNSTLNFIEKEGETDYCSMVNFAVENINSPFFCVFEFDDVLNHKWFQNFENHQNAYPDVKCFLPIVAHVDNDNNYITLQNEISWAMQSINENNGTLEVESASVEDLGFVRFDSVSKKMKYSIAGAIFNTEAFVTVGKFKPSHKIHFDYEFLLRFLYKGNTTMVIPRIGIKHTNLRDNSFSKKLQSINLDEKKFWYALSRKEYVFPQDRGITYEEAK